MSKYMIETEHTSEECLNALDEFQAKGLLEKSDFGCQAGVHTSWVTLEAKNDDEAMNRVPSSLQSKSKIVKLNKFSNQQVKEFHKM